MEILTVKEFTKRQFEVLLRGKPNSVLDFIIRGSLSFDGDTKNDYSNIEYKGHLINEYGNIKVVRRKLDNKIISFGESSSSDVTLIEFSDDYIHCTVVNIITGEKKIIEINQFDSRHIVDECLFNDFDFTEAVKVKIRKASNFGTIEFS